MTRRALAPALALAILAVVAAGCRSAEPTVHDVPDQLPPGTTTEDLTPDESPTYSSTEIPPIDQIDLAYVQWILADAITPVEDEAIRLQAVAREAGATRPPAEVFDLYGAIYGGEVLQAFLKEAAESWESGTWTSPVKAKPEPVLVETGELVDISSRCIIATFVRDLSPRMVEADGPAGLIVLLEPKPQEMDPLEVNPSPWRIARLYTLESVTGTPACG